MPVPDPELLAKVKSLARVCDPDLIPFAEGLLADIRAGKVNGVLIVTQGSDGIGYTVCGIRDRFVVTGYLYHALHKLQTDVGS